MTIEMKTTQAPDDAEESRNWRPSLKPEHRVVDPGANGVILEQSGPNGISGLMAAYLKRPFVKLIVGLAIFILAALVYDATVNFGSWTERPPPKRATKHPGLAPVPKTPD